MTSLNSRSVDARWPRALGGCNGLSAISGAALAFVLVWSTSATAIETPTARLYRAVTDLCLEHYLRDKVVNADQLNTGQSLIVHCDCMARFLFPHMDADAVRQLETRIPDKIKSSWDDAALICAGRLR
jgi:hypothetical protein